MTTAAQVLSQFQATGVETCFHDRHIDRAFQLLVVVVTEFRLSIAFEIIGRLVRDEQNSATCGVTSEQSTLRPVQNLHVLQVEELARAGIAGLQRNLREIGGDARVLPLR